MTEERRKFKRFDAFMSVKLRCPGSGEFSNVDMTNDLSREGIKVSSRQSVERGTVVDLEIAIPDDPKPVYTTGEIIWTKNRGQGSDFDLGIKFLMMDPVDKFRILDYAYNNWLDSKVNDFEDPESVSETDINA